MLATYTLTYPASAKAGFSPIAIAIANSFDPFPNPAPAAASNPAAAGPNAQKPIEPPPPANPALVGNGLIIAAGLVVTSLPDLACRDWRVGQETAMIVQHDKVNRLMLLSAGSTAGPAIGLRSNDSAGDSQVAVMAFAERPAIEAAARDDLFVAPGALRSGAGGMRVSAAAPGVAAGGAIFDRSGAFIGIVAAGAEASKGAGLAAMSIRAWPVIDAKTLKDFVAAQHLGQHYLDAKPAASAAELSLGEIVAENRAALVPVYCLPY